MAAVAVGKQDVDLRGSAVVLERASWSVVGSTSGLGRSKLRSSAAEAGTAATSITAAATMTTARFIG